MNAQVADDPLLHSAMQAEVLNHNKNIRSERNSNANVEGYNDFIQANGTATSLHEDNVLSLRDRSRTSMLKITPHYNNQSNHANDDVMTQNRPGSCHTHPSTCKKAVKKSSIQASFTPAGIISSLGPDEETSHYSEQIKKSESIPTTKSDADAVKGCSKLHYTKSISSLYQRNNLSIDSSGASLNNFTSLSSDKNLCKSKEKFKEKDVSSSSNLFSSSSVQSKTNSININLSNQKVNQSVAKKQTEHAKSQKTHQDERPTVSYLNTDSAQISSVEITAKNIRMGQDGHLNIDEGDESRRTESRHKKEASTSSSSSMSSPWVRPENMMHSPESTKNNSTENSVDNTAGETVSLSFNSNNRNGQNCDTLSKATTGIREGSLKTDSNEELERIVSNAPEDRTTSGQRSSSDSGHNDRVRSDLELLTRPSWCDAKFALSRVKQGKAKGNSCALRVRAFLHQILFSFGCRIQKNAWIVLLAGLLVLTGCAIGLKFAHMETDLEKLWVEDGGELQDELKYTNDALAGSSAGYSIQMLIQTGKDTLTAESLLLHLKAALAATEVSVSMYNLTWKFSDVCFKFTLPIEDETNGIITNILDKILPCFLITPLDCFWEGSKLLGPDPPIYLNPTESDITWKNLNPLGLLQRFTEYIPSPSLNKTLQSYKILMEEAGITSGYTERWCLDPYDPQCPKTAVNYQTKQTPDITSLFKSGCSGYATELMQWPLDLIVGGIQRNSSGNITGAQGLQTLFNLMGAQNMYEFHKGYKTGTQWSVERAQNVLSEWQRRFVNKMYQIADSRNTSDSNSDSLYAFSVATATDILEDFSSISPFRVFGGYLLMIAYACITLWHCRASRSQAAVGVLGVLLVALSVAAGLGISSLIGISFNAASTQVLPFLLLGLGVDDMFLMAHYFGEISLLNYIPFQERTGECLKRVGVSVVLTSIAILSGFLFSLIIPMPALRHFGMQAAIVTGFNLISILIIFPAILSIDLKRRKNNKLDIFCCYDSTAVNEVVDLTEGNTRQNGVSSHPCVAYYPPVLDASHLTHSAPLPGATEHIYGEGPEATITMHHTIQAFSNDSFITVVGNSAETNVPPGHVASRTTETTIPPYSQHPRTPPPEYSASAEKKVDKGDNKPPPSRPRVAFVNAAISEPGSTGRSTPVTSGGVSGRVSRRGNGSNPPTNLTTPMESVRSSTHSLVSHRRKGRGQGCFSKKSGRFYSCLATLPSLTLNQLGEHYYAPFLLKNPVRVAVVVLFIGLLGACSYGATTVKDGLDLGDVLPRDTREHSALVAQTTYFSFYNMYIVTQEFDYASNQQNLHRLHDSMGTISYVMRNTDGTLTEYWLGFFRKWLQGLQDAFDKDWTAKLVNSSTWTPQASSKTVLAFKLLVQTGKPDEPADSARIGCTNASEPCERINRVRLVSDDGIIREDAFYNYLSAWVGNDPLTYAASQAEIRPKPISWSFKRDNNLVIDRSPSIIYAQMPFYLNNMRENQDFVNVINWVRGRITDIEEETDVEAYPNGYPFTFWQQYIDLRFWLFVSLGAVIAAVFVVLSLVLFNIWAGAIMALFLAMIAGELLGFMGFLNVKLSAVPAVILVASIGLGVEFTVHIVFAYITSCGTRKARVTQSIGHMLGPVIDGAISTLLGVIMLAFAEFDFIVTYFFKVLGVLILLGVLNGLVLLPVVLSLIGPPAEVVPVDGGSRLNTPTPPSTPLHEMESGYEMHHHACGMHNSNSNNNNTNFHCYHRSPVYHQRYPHYTGSHCSSRDDVQACSRYHVAYRRNAHLEPGAAYWRNGRGQSMPRHHPDCIQHAPHCIRRHGVPHRRGHNVSWQHHPHAVPSNRTEGGGQVFLYPHTEYVVYSASGTPPNERLQDNHCETDFNTVRSPPVTGSDNRNSQIPTLTATSSLTVKLHSSRRQPVVAYVDPASVASHSSQSTSTGSHSNPSELENVGLKTFEDLPQISRRHFDISALNTHDVNDAQNLPGQISS